jgi:hypothetical protein
MPKGNARDPFTVDGGIDWDGNSRSDRGFGIGRAKDGDDPADNWGQPDAASMDHINKYSNHDDRGEFEFGFTNEKTVLDKPLNASPARVKKTSAQYYYEGDDRWYRGGKKG